ncbi:hypothetical protein SLA2020_351140 [Shorea laevis]
MPNHMTIFLLLILPFIISPSPHSSASPRPQTEGSTSRTISTTSSTTRRTTPGSNGARNRRPRRSSISGHPICRPCRRRISRPR